MSKQRAARTTEALALFELPAAAALPRPASPLEGVGAVTYAPYRPKHPERCQDCLQVALEANRGGQGAPLSRQARFTRSQGSTRVRLCAEHKHAREDEELAARVAAELKAAGPP